MNVLQNISRNILNIPGWRTNRKIVVIESDDWGSIRMPSKESYCNLLKAGIAVDKDFFSRYDSLESADDLTALFDVLVKFKDSIGNHPVITANTIMANPDFKKIKEANYEEYFYEPFTNTYNKYIQCEKSFQLFSQGIDNQLIKPQFHGREHLNVMLWMNELKNKNKELHLAFENGTFGIPLSSHINNRKNLMASFDCVDQNHFKSIVEIALDGTFLFKKIFGFSSNTIMAPSYIWPKRLETHLIGEGIMGFQGNRLQFEPRMKNGKHNRIFHYTGQKNKLSQRYIVRNAFFEPTHFPGQDQTKEILDRMRINFQCYKPTIISTHRLNFIGSLDEKNRSSNLIKLQDLLKSILVRWPNIEFMSTPDLLSLMQTKK